MKVLVTGATGYIGGRLIPRLLELGMDVRVLVRDVQRVAGRPWRDRVEIVTGDLTDIESLEGCTDGVEVAYYLVHSMNEGRDFALRDRIAAENFCRIAGEVRHTIYIGGLVPRRKGPGIPRGSEHLRSRAETGRILARSLRTTELRAGPIIGSGSASFEMVRYATERLPIMLAPSWVANTVHPVAIRDVLSYLVLALQRGPSGVVEIGAEPLTYRQMMLDYASARNLRRVILPLPTLLPSWLGAGWIGLMTPIPATLARPLVGGMAESLRARRGKAQRLFPEVSPVRYKEAVQLALIRIGVEDVETRWSDAGGAPKAYAYSDKEGVVREERSVLVAASQEQVFRVFTGLGGARGWLTWCWAWAIRGVIDRSLGGPGLRRGRRHRDEILHGEALDFWRVEALEAPRIMRLRAEALLPGEAWLEWKTEAAEGGTLLTQVAAFAPRGLYGLIYWYVLYPFHRQIFNALVRAIAERAENPVQEAPLVPVTVRLPRPTAPPRERSGVLGGMRDYVLRTPPIATRIDFSSLSERQDYSDRVMRRLGRDVSNYSVLNLHKIGVDAPARFVFDALLSWDRDSSCWPNELVTIEREGQGLGLLKLWLFGKSWLRHCFSKKPLFQLKLLQVRLVPSAQDPDDGRFLLFQCEGGYPIGIFAYYVRSSISDRRELDQTQVFVGAGFDFYGKERWPLFHPVNRVWESIHDRVTRNMLNRFKQLCEWQYDRSQSNS
ncbi:MAG: hypothetical protein ACI9F9_003288 [Candidatus Paceibacteria bacterium]|jgi:uncharacterized protein YbjT (DUF2867 family)